MVQALTFMADIVCTPDGGTNEQIIRVIIKYIEARPARMHESFLRLALEAMVEAWPCPKR
jgi:hypothetical protein